MENAGPLSNKVLYISNVFICIYMRILVENNLLSLLLFGEQIDRSFWHLLYFNIRLTEHWLISLRILILSSPIAKHCAKFDKQNDRPLSALAHIKNTRLQNTCKYGANNNNNEPPKKKTAKHLQSANTIQPRRQLFRSSRLCKSWARFKVSFRRGGGVCEVSVFAKQGGLSYFHFFFCG